MACEYADANPSIVAGGPSAAMAKMGFEGGGAEGIGVAASVEGGGAEGPGVAASAAADSQDSARASALCCAARSFDEHIEKSCHARKQIC